MKKRRELNPPNDDKVSCLFKEDGMDIEELLKQSFRLFVKHELMKQCG